MTRTFLLFLISILGVSFAQDVDVNLVAKHFGRAANKTRIMKLEPHFSYGDFFEKFSKLNQRLIDDVIIELYRQAMLDATFLLNSITSLKEQLDHELNTQDEATYSYVNVLLEKLNQRLEMFLELKPGSVNPLLEPLPEIPPREETFRYFVNYHPMKDLFLDLRTIIDTHMSNIRLIIDILFRKGWESARGAYDELQEQFRHEFLNRKTLATVGITVMNLLSRSNDLKPCVAPETWQKFENLANSVKDIFDEIKPSLNEVIPVKFTYDTSNKTLSAN